MALLELEGISKAFGEGASRHQVLDGVNLSVKEGEFLVIVGFSGSGKTTLLSLLAGLTTPDTGRIQLAGKEIRGPGTDRGVVFQQYSLLPWLSVAENIRLAVDQVSPDWPAEQRKAHVDRMISLVNLSHAHDRRPHELSGGMRQRVAVARALAMNPKILLLDEPFGALDALTRSTLQSELARIWQSDSKTVVMITNDVDEAILLGDRIVPLTAKGKLAEPIAVELPRPREHAALNHDARFKALRRQITDVLVASAEHSTGSGGKVAPLPAIQPDHALGRRPRGWFAGGLARAGGAR